LHARIVHNNEQEQKKLKIRKAKKTQIFAQNEFGIF
jgi:hypothetical protein